MSELNYWIGRSGETMGPYVFDQLKSMWQSGAMLSDDQINDGVQWLPVASYAPYFAPSMVAKRVLPQAPARSWMRKQFSFGSLVVLIFVVFVVVAAIRSGMDSSGGAPEPAQTDERPAFRALALQEIQRAKDAIAARKVYVGMDSDDARKSWGEPEHVTKTTDGEGTSEEWDYPSGSVLYIEDGEISTIQN
ncbi:MAG: hypothetical protein ABSE62_04845 [Chthoniobacteraceae bacterium]|jgi:hypothetical protein